MIPLIPMPNYILDLHHTLSFKNYQFLIEEKYKNAILHFNLELSSRLIIDENASSYQFEFFINKDLKDEEYIIHMDDMLTHIEAKTEKGFYYATRTLSQLFSLKSKKKVKSIRSKCYLIEDKPRFSFRSLMLDECRHFFNKEEVKKIIAQISDLKMNYFHWHLSDDQGFRIDFRSFPLLKEIASSRNKTKINSQDNDEWDNNIYSGCYSYQDIKEIIHYAKTHYVEIIPEIDMPGHTSAIVAAYPFLHCFNEKHEVRGDFGVFKEIMCVGKQSTYDFCKKLLDELVTLFKDSHYIHIGGDEVNHENYEKCEDCQRKMKELNLSSTSQLQAHFCNEMASHIQNKFHKKVIVWHDGVYDLTNPNIIMQYWDYKMDEKRIDYINNGRKCIYSPCSQFYFNDPYGELPLARTYNRGIHLDKLSKKAYKNILGMECCIWTEWILNDKMLEFNLNPRLFAFAETSWTNTINRDFKGLVERIENQDDFYKYYNLTHATKKIYLARGEKYRKEISNRYRGKEKDVELSLLKTSDIK